MQPNPNTYVNPEFFLRSMSKRSGSSSDVDRRLARLGTGHLRSFQLLNAGKRSQRPLVRRMFVTVESRAGPLVEDSAGEQPVVSLNFSHSWDGISRRQAVMFCDFRVTGRKSTPADKKGPFESFRFLLGAIRHGPCGIADYAATALTEGSCAPAMKSLTHWMGASPPRPRCVR